ncbi:MAG: hypothetical protein J5687_06335 [Treponema sp.]|nr:hypothetical protein [Treponema sp.]
MLSSILKKSDCASCKFCCSFRRQSLWETPVFSNDTAQKLQALFPQARFRQTSSNSKTIDLSHLYKTDNPNEEAPCPFLDSKNGCSLPPELKPFDCSIWPFRAVRTKENTIEVALTPTCPAINKVPLEKIKALLDSGLRQKIIDYAANHPDIIKEQSDFLSNIM